MGYRTARRIHILLMSWLAVIFLLAWLPMLRGLMDGPSYEWGGGHFGFQFSGAGLAGDYGFVLVKSAIAVAFLLFGWRRPNGAFRAALVGWLALMLCDTLYNVIADPEAFRFRGDTLGIDISLVVMAPALDGAMLLLGTAWAFRAPPLPVPPLGRINFVLLGLAGALLPVQYLLLSRGGGQDGSDVSGVLLTMLGWSLLSFGLGF
jgi:hypothetical protein